MDNNELRARIRHLMASGDLPPLPPLANGTLSGPAAARATPVVIGRPTPEPCLICGEADLRVSYWYVKGKVLRNHAACDALWRQEREARFS